jgi:hypothetical protein
MLTLPTKRHYYYHYCVYSSSSCSRSEYAGYPFSIRQTESHLPNLLKNFYQVISYRAGSSLIITYILQQLSLKLEFNGSEHPEQGSRNLPLLSRTLGRSGDPTKLPLNDPTRALQTPGRRMPFRVAAACHQMHVCASGNAYSYATGVRSWLKA